ncbi:MAG TPA: DUF2141 domain-containing protein [Azospirillum sp.]|nr:DUF2141 domain-containing protein [Azospirillum sp.]
MLRPAALCLALLLPVPAHALDLTVVVDGVDPAKGPLMVGLFDRADLFDRAPATQNQAIAGLRVEPGGGRVSVALTGLPPGRYAAAVFQDRDRNGTLDTNLLGIPSEPYGFSTKAGLGRPSFDAASADSATGTLRVRIGE